MSRLPGPGDVVAYQVWKWNPATGRFDRLARKAEVIRYVPAARSVQVWALWDGGDYKRFVLPLSQLVRDDDNALLMTPAGVS